MKDKLMEMIDKYGNYVARCEASGNPKKGSYGEEINGLQLHDQILSFIKETCEKLKTEPKDTFPTATCPHDFIDMETRIKNKQLDDCMKAMGI